MDMMSPKVSTEVKRIWDWNVRKILVPESYDFLLGNEERELIFSSIIQLRKLNTVDFCTNVGRQISHSGILQEVRKCWVGILSMLFVLEGLKWRVSVNSQWLLLL